MHAKSSALRVGVKTLYNAILCAESFIAFALWASFPKMSICGFLDYSAPRQFSMSGKAWRRSNLDMMVFD